MPTIFTAMQKYTACAFLILLITGCTGMAPINTRVTQVNQDEGYRVTKVLGSNTNANNTADTLVLLAFSGGGTRAAAFSYGVLEELRRTNIVRNNRTYPLIDEVDVISGVSGGSFTALSYALMGDRLFTEFEPNFLKRNVQDDELLVALVCSWCVRNSNVEPGN